VIAEVFLKWLNIQVVWVDAPYRRCGIGTSLMMAAEAEAIRRGADRAYVDTMAFQSPAFYSQVGYVEFGRLSQFVPIYDRIFFEKQLPDVLDEIGSISGRSSESFLGHEREKGFDHLRIELFALL
jgi:predicted N-acetyltransferase YhbS